MLFKYKKLSKKAQTPTKAHDEDAGFDLYSSENIFLEPNVPAKISTDIAFEMTSGWKGLIWDRSSLGSKGIHVLGGVIDSSYRGEVKVILINLTNSYYEIKEGDKIAQIIFSVNPFIQLEETDSMTETERGEKGFGSSGK